MNNRCWLWLLLIAACWVGVPALAGSPREAPAKAGTPTPPRTVVAQSRIIVRDSGGGSFITVWPHKESHRELPGGPDMKAGQEMMAERLRALHELHQLQDQVQDLLKDPDFLENVKNNFTEEQLRRLREKILKGDGLGQDKDWNALLGQTVSMRKLDERQIAILRRWAERSDSKPSIQPIDQSKLMPEDGRPAPSVPSPARSSPSNAGTSLSPADSVEPSLWDRLQEKTAAWIEENMDGLAGDVMSALTELAATEEGAPLAELLRAMKQPDFSGGGPSFIDQAAGLSRYLPKLGEFLHEQRGAWDEVHSIFGGAHMPSLPHGGEGPSLPRLPAAPPAESGDWGSGTLALVGLGVLLLLLWKMGGLSGWRAFRGEGDDWQLGPWPVPPTAVATRQDLVRAFEHLALLCLGPAARTCHHRELAERLAEQDSGDPARRRHAAELLAWLYEQARYAPAAEPLSSGELTEARHALCYLAGVTAA